MRQVQRVVRLAKKNAKGSHRILSGLVGQCDGLWLRWGYSKLIVTFDHNPSPNLTLSIALYPDTTLTTTLTLISMLTYY